MAAETPDELHRLAVDRLANVATAMGAHLPEMTSALHKLLAESIVELQGDPLILELLGASIESNLETFVHILRYDIVIDETSAPAAAEEYARRLAQRGISSNALVRAYRLGQSYVLDWAFNEIARSEPNPRVGFAAGQLSMAIMFTYIDTISEKVVLEYEAERERWLANRSQVRAAMLEELLSGEKVDVGPAEAALGYRLRQHHLGVILWSTAAAPSAAEFRRLEKLVLQLGRAINAAGHPLFFPKDRSTGWAWIPLGRSPEPPRLEHLEAVVERSEESLQVAIGTPGAGVPGFRVTHLEASRAQRVARADLGEARRLTSFTNPDVRVAAMLASDIEGTRRLVHKSLGALAVNTEQAGRLRDTLLVFLTEKGSYTATAERVHLHKNTVKYRVDKAIEERARPLDDERLDLVLALIACQWLGGSVLRSPE